MPDEQELAERAEIRKARSYVTGLVVNSAAPAKIENARRDAAYLIAQRDIRKIVAAMPWLTDQGRHNLAAVILDQSSDA